MSSTRNSSRRRSADARARSEADGSDVVVVGAGVIGAAVALALARRDLDVTVVDPGVREERATWAAGGMLSPLGEADEPGPFLDLALRSLALYPAFVTTLEPDAEDPVGFRVCGKLHVARSETEERSLRARYAWQSTAGHPVEWVAGDLLRHRIPELAPSVRAGLLLESDGTVDNRRLGDALRRSAREEGCGWVEARVRGLLHADGRVTGVELGDGSRLGTDRVVIAAGAWSGNLDGLPTPLPVRPIRGQMISYAGAAHLVPRIVESAGAYLIPRFDAGSRTEPPLVVGATVEEGGFDRSNDPGSVRRLHREAAALLPALAGSGPSATWVGLRPGTPDELPVLGADEGLEGLFYATGHFRNGILLAPVTAKLLERAICDGEAVPAPFRPGRFQS